MIGLIFGETNFPNEILRKVKKLAQKRIAEKLHVDLDFNL